MNAPKTDSPPKTEKRNLAWDEDGIPTFEMVGSTFTGQDLYHHLLTLSWGRLLAALFGGFVLFNVVFAGLYLLGGDCISAENPTSFLQAFSFSVQTMASIGYGAMAPTTPYAYMLSNVEGFLGLLGVAMASAFMFAKFSRPTARVRFSNRIVIHPQNGVQTMFFRMSNERGNQLVEAQLSVIALVESVSMEGDRMRRIVDVPLVRERSPIFSLSWVAMHRLDEHSPLSHLVTQDGVRDDFLALIVNLTGMDDTMIQTVHARHFYGPKHFLWNHRFRDMVDNKDDGSIVIHLDRIDDVEPCAG